MIHRLLLILLIASLWYAPTYQTAIAHTSDYAQMRKEMRYPIVLVQTDTGDIGSGVIIYSKQHGIGEVQEWNTYIITANHVADGQPFVAFTAHSSTLLHADVVAFDSDNDLALLRVRNTAQEFPDIAYFQSYDDPVEEFEDVWAVGAGLGLPSFHTKGTVSNPAFLNDSQIFIQSSAHTIYGNSGGGLFQWSGIHNRYELIGIVESIMILSDGTPIPHIGFAIPMKTISNFLTEEGFGFIVRAQESQ